MVLRASTSKKGESGFRGEAKSYLSKAKTFLVLLIQRIDLLTVAMMLKFQELFESCIPTTRPQSDLASRTMPSFLLKNCSCSYILLLSFLPGQFDQRADSAAGACSSSAREASRLSLRPHWRWPEPH